MSYAGYHDSLVLCTMCEEPGPWVKTELLTEFDSALEAEDALNRLVRRGLVVAMKGGLVTTTAVGRYVHALSQERG